MFPAVSSSRCGMVVSPSFGDSLTRNGESSTHANGTAPQAGQTWNNCTTSKVTYSRSSWHHDARCNLEMQNVSANHNPRTADIGLGMIGSAALKNRPVGAAAELRWVTLRPRRERTGAPLLGWRCTAFTQPIERAEIQRHIKLNIRRTDSNLIGQAVSISLAWSLMDFHCKLFHLAQIPFIGCFFQCFFFLQPRRDTCMLAILQNYIAYCSYVLGGDHCCVEVQRTGSSGPKSPPRVCHCAAW